MPPHWHAYSYTGRSYSDAQIRRGETPANYPPIEIKDWLKQPHAHIVGTFHNIDVAADWMTGELKASPPADDDAFPIATRIAYVRATLTQSTGNDVVYGYYTQSGQYLSRALIVCPRPGMTCPAP